MSNYLLRDVPADLWDRAKAKSESDGIALRTILIALLEAYVDRGVRLVPGDAPKRKGKRK